MKGIYANIRVNLNKIKVIQSFDLFITSKRNSKFQKNLKFYRNIIQIMSMIISDNVISYESLQLF